MTFGSAKTHPGNFNRIWHQHLKSSFNPIISDVIPRLEHRCQITEAVKAPYSWNHDWIRSLAVSGSFSKNVPGKLWVALGLLAVHRLEVRIRRTAQFACLLCWRLFDWVIFRRAWFAIGVHCIWNVWYWIYSKRRRQDLITKHKLCFTEVLATTGATKHYLMRFLIGAYLKLLVSSNKDSLCNYGQYKWSWMSQNGVPLKLCKIQRNNM